MLLLTDHMGDELRLETRADLPKTQALEGVALAVTAEEEVWLTQEHVDELATFLVVELGARVTLPYLKSATLLLGAPERDLEVRHDRYGGETEADPPTAILGRSGEGALRGDMPGEYTLVNEGEPGYE